MQNSQPGIIVVVVEPRPRWTPELQRQFLGEAVRVRQCATFASLRKLASEYAVVVVDLDHAPAETLQFLGQHVGRQPRPTAIALASARTAELEWTTRDLGAVDFLVDIPTGERLARLCRRQWTVDGR